MANTPQVIKSLPGIKRDGTEFEGDNYTDGQWCRFQRGLPRKIGGCRAVTSTFLEKVYGAASYSSAGTQYQHLGQASTLTQLRLTAAGILSGSSNRTPGTLVVTAANVWQFDVQADTTGGSQSFIFAHPGQNLIDIDNTVETSIYYGNVTDTTALATTLTDPQSGGVVVLAPYVLTYGNAGRVDIYSPAALAQVNSLNVTGQKIVKGLPMRSGGNGPAGIFWSLDSVIRATFTSEAEGFFAFDTISATSSILSSRAVVEYDGVFYWAGVDRFMLFNGVVREIPNPLNSNWFFDNLNFAQRQKVFAMTVPRYGEIWWCYPRGAATECTHAVIFNVRENCWYDTELLGSGRSDGIFAKVYNKPFMVDVDLTGTGYTWWQHETGMDQVIGAVTEPIQSWFQTSDMTMLTIDKPENKAMNVHWFEPDFVQSGDLLLTVTGRINARAPAVSSEVFTIVEAPDRDQQIIPLKEARRLMQFRVETNTPGGDYQMGQCIAHIQPGDGRMVT
jgi:hypothetical protein